MIPIASSKSGKRDAQVLIVDDDVELCALLRDYLVRQGLAVETVHTAEDALERLRGTPPDLMVLDVMLPGMDGLDALRRVRELTSMPVLMLSGRGEPVDRVVGLELGADDYLAKPCLPRELLARIHALLRRSQGASSAGEWRLGALRLHGGQRRAWLDDEELSLTAAEFSVLQELVRRPSQILTREELTERALHRPLEKFDRSIDVHVSRLRNKLKRDATGLQLDAVRGAGYVLTLQAGRA